MATDAQGRSNGDLAEARLLLGAAGIEPPDTDLATFARVLPSLRRRVDRMYAVDTGDEVTAAVFRAGDIEPEVGS